MPACAHCTPQALQEGLRLLGIFLDCGPAQQSPGATALVRSRLPSRSGTASSSAQDLPAAAAVARADSEVLREAHPQGSYLGHLFQQELPPVGGVDFRVKGV